MALEINGATTMTKLDLSQVLMDLSHIEACLPKQYEELVDLIQHIKDLQQYLDAGLHDLCRCIMQDSEHDFDNLYNSAVNNIENAEAQATMIYNIVDDVDVVKSIRNQYLVKMLEETA